jgi:hypothetical protein
MADEIKCGKDHPWHTRSGLFKRINSFAVYILAAFFSLYDPDGADIAMYQTLRDQYEARP